MSLKYTVEQLTARHLRKFTNVLPSDVGLWVYVIDGRAYGFTYTREEAIARARNAVGDS